MQEKDKIPVSQVIDDMYSDRSMVSGAARDYYLLNYATEEERKQIEKDIKIENTIGLVFYCLFIISVLLIPFIKYLC